MDNKAFNLIYSHASKNGYNGTQEDFLELLKSNSDALKMSFDYAKSEGYNGDEDSFKSLVGIMPTNKKKEDTDSELEAGSSEPVEVVDEAIIQETQEEPTAIERQFGKNVVTDFFGDIYRAGAQGQAQGQSLDEAVALFGGGKDVSDEQIQDFIRAQEELSRSGQSDEMIDFQRIYEENGGGVLGFILGVGNNPSVLPQLFVSSTSALVNPMSAAASGAGAGVGAGVGSVIPGVGTATGAIAGAMGAAGGVLETGLTFAELLQEEVDGELNVENIRSVLEDEEAFTRLRNKSLARGMTIAAFEALSGGLAGKVTSKVAGMTGRKLVAAGAGGATEMAGGSLGEVAGRVAAGQEQDVAETLFEGVTGAVTAPITVGYGLYKSPKYYINKSKGGERARVSGPEMADFIKTATPEQIMEAEISIENDPVLEKIARDKYNKATIRDKIKKAYPEISEDKVNEIIPLQEKLDRLEGNDIEVAKARKKQLKEQINAIQERKTEEVPMGEQAQPGEEVDQEVREQATEQDVETQEVDTTVDKPKFNEVSKKVNKNLPVNENDLNDGINQAYDALDQLEGNTSEDAEIMRSLIEDEIEKLEAYENITETQTRKVAEEKTVRTTKKTPRKTTPIREKEFVGKKAVYSDNKGGGGNGTIIVQEGPDGREYYVLEQPNENKVVLGRRDRAFQDGKVNLDNEGNATSVTFPMSDGKQVTIKSPEIAQQVELEQMKQQDYDEQVFEETYIEIVGEEKVEVPKQKQGKDETKQVTQEEQPMLEGVQASRTEEEVGQEGSELRTQEEQEVEQQIQEEEAVTEIEGYDRMQGEIDGIIEKSKNKKRSKQDTLDNVLAYLQEDSAVYERATDVQREKLVRDVRAKLGFKEKRPPSARKVTGQPARKKVTVDEMAALKDQTRLEARAAKEAKGDLNSKRKQLSDYVRSLIKDGAVSVKQAGSLINRISKINLDNDKAVNDFVNYAGKVFEDADYTDKVSKANSFKKKARKRSKSKTLPVNIKLRLEELASIDPSKVSDIDKYNEVVDELSAAISGVKSKKYAPLNEESVQQKLDDLSLEQDKYIEDEIRSVLEFGDIDLTRRELEELLDSENFDEYAKNLTEAKRKELRDLLIKVAEYSKIGLEGYKAPDTANAKERSNLKELKQLDVSDLTTEELRQYIRFVDNLVNNDSFDGIGIFASRARASVKSKAFVKSLPKRIIDSIKAIGKNESELLSLPLMLKRVLGTSNSAKTFQIASGISNYFNGIVNYKDKLYSIKESYSDLLASIKKKDPKIKSFESNVERGVAAVMIQEGDKRILETIETLENDNSGEYDVYLDAVKKAHEKLKGKTNDEIFEALGDNAKALEFWIKENNKIVDPLEDVTRRVHNEKFVRENPETYTHISILNIADKSIDGDSKKFNLNAGRIVKPKQTPSTIQRKDSPSLAPGTILDFNFDQNMESQINKNLFDINLSESIMDMRNFFLSSNVRDVMTNQTMDRLSTFMQNSIDSYKGFPPPKRAVERLASNIVRLLRKLGYTGALGSITQVVRQYPSVSVNAIINLGTDANLFFKSYDMDAEIFKNYTIGRRGETLGGLERGESFNEAIGLAAIQDGDLLSTLNELAREAEIKTEKVRDALFTSLRYGDTMAAKRAWAAFYTQYLKNNGVDVSSIDFSKEHTIDSELRRRAAQYAEDKVSETQVPSEFTQLPLLLQSGGSTMREIAKNIFLPFSTFSINAKGRMYVDIGIIKNKNYTKEQKSQAWQSLLATMGEIVTFHGLTIFGIGQLKEVSKDALLDFFGVEREEDEDDDNQDFWWKKFYSYVLRDFFVSGFSGMAEDSFIDVLNWGAKKYKDVTGEKISKAEWEKKKPFYRYSGEAKSYGLLGAAYGMIVEANKTGEVVFDYRSGEVPEIKTPYGYKKLDNLTDEEVNFLTVTYLVESMQAAGLSDAFIARLFSAGKMDIFRGKTGGEQNVVRSSDRSKGRSSGRRSDTRSSERR